MGGARSLEVLYDVLRDVHTYKEVQKRNEKKREHNKSFVVVAALPTNIFSKVLIFSRRSLYFPDALTLLSQQKTSHRYL